MINKYIKKPMIIEAIQWLGDNQTEIQEWAGDEVTFGDRPYIHTLEGNMYISLGDFIIKGLNGEFYPCKPDIFIKTYDLLEGE